MDHAMTQTVLCLKWGTLYGPHYVNRMYSMVRRHTLRPLRFVCITDDAAGIDKGIEIKPMPPLELPEFFRFRPFRRMFIWKEQLYDLEGNVLHFDLDLLVTGNIDDLFDYKPEVSFCVAENWSQLGERIGNMSIFRFRVGSHPYVYDRFAADPMDAVAKYRNSQTYVSRTIGEMEFFPPEWCASFKYSLIPAWPLNFIKTPALPKEVRAVAFHGKPEIDDALAGRWPSAWYKKLYKHVRPTPWIAEHWR